MKRFILMAAVICITASMAYGVNMLLSFTLLDQPVDGFWSGMSMVLFGNSGDTLWFIGTR